MPVPPVVVVPPSRSERPGPFIHALSGLVLALNLPLVASAMSGGDLSQVPASQAQVSRIQENRAPELETGEHWLARIELHTAAELKEALERAASLFESGRWRADVDTPVTFILHGAEAKSLLRDRYLEHKSLVDLAARLTAFEVVEIKVCETWMGGERIEREQLPPFIGTVPFGPAEERRLLEEQGFQYF